MTFSAPQLTSMIAFATVHGDDWKVREIHSDGTLEIAVHPYSVGTGFDRYVRVDGSCYAYNADTDEDVPADCAPIIDFYVSKLDGQPKRFSW